MTDIHECEKEGCTNTFDLDNSEGVVVSNITNKGVIKHFYCCAGHRP